MGNFQKAINVDKSRNSLVASSAMGSRTTYLFMPHSWLVLSTHPGNQIDTTQSHGDGKELGTLSLALAVHIKNPNSSSIHFPDLGSMHASQKLENRESCQSQPLSMTQKGRKCLEGSGKIFSTAHKRHWCHWCGFSKALSHSWESSKQNTTPHSFQFT